MVMAMVKFRVGDIVIPNRIIYDDSGHKVKTQDWCDYEHEYRILVNGNNQLSYKLEGITNGRMSFYLGEPFFTRNFKLKDDLCGKCSSRCRSDKGKCGLYSE